MIRANNIEKAYTAQRNKLLLTLKDLSLKLEHIVTTEEKLNLDIAEAVIMQIVAEHTQEDVAALPIRKPTPDNLEELSRAIDICNELVFGLNKRGKVIKELTRTEINVQEILNRDNFDSLILGNINGQIMRVEDFMAMAESKDYRRADLPIELVTTGIAVPRNAWLN